MCNSSNAKLDSADNYDSIYIMGKHYYPENCEYLVTPEGGEIPNGQLVERALPDNVINVTPDSDEFIIFEADQTVLRYIVRYE